MNVDLDGAQISDHDEENVKDVLKWEWGSRKSAFLPYRPVSTVLTNLQRGNTEAKSGEEEIKFDFYARAAQGEITIGQIHAEGCDTLDVNGYTCLHWASFYGQSCTVNMLLECGASVDKLGSESETALLLAAAGGHYDTIKLLLDNGADVNHCDIVGNTALMYAAAGNHPHSCHNLLLKGADLTLTNDNDDTPYSLAIKRKSFAVVSENYVGLLFFNHQFEIFAFFIDTSPEYIHIVLMELIE